MTWNTLDVPLETGWQCTLIPGPQYCDLMRWGRSYHVISARALYPNAGRDHSAWSWNARPLSEVDKSELWERDRLRQLADDRSAFAQHLRPNWDLRSVVGQKALRDVQTFVRDQLNVAHWNLPTDNAGSRKLLLDAVVSGQLVPVVDREYRGVLRVALPDAAPQYWRATGDGGNDAYPPKVITYGEFRALQCANGELPGISSIARGGVAAKAGDDSDWLGVVRSAAEALADGDDDKPNLAESMGDDSAVNDLSNASTPLGNVQPFELGDATNSDNVLTIAARGVSEANEAECFAQYERDMAECTAYRSAMGGQRFMDLCSQHAFQNYQQCRGY